MTREFTVEKSTESKNGGFVNTIVAESKVKVFGVEKTTKHRLLFKTDVAPEVGAKQEIDLSKYNIVQRESITQEGVIITSQWLHEKVEA